MVRQTESIAAMPRPIHCPQCHSPSYRHIHGDQHQCNHCGSTFIIPHTPASAPISTPEPPRAKLKRLLIILAILLAAAWLLEMMWAA